MDKMPRTVIVGTIGHIDQGPSRGVMVIGSGVGISRGLTARIAAQLALLNVPVEVLDRDVHQRPGKRGYEPVSIDSLSMIDEGPPDLAGKSRSFEAMKNKPKNRDRNNSCPCGSGKKFKKCCLLIR